MFTWLRRVFGRWIGRTGEPVYRITLDWDGTTEQMIEALSHSLGMERGEVFRRALAVYDMMTAMREGGHRFIAIDREGNWRGLAIFPREVDTCSGSPQPHVYRPAGPEGRHTTTDPE